MNIRRMLFLALATPFLHCGDSASNSTSNDTSNAPLTRLTESLGGAAALDAMRTLSIEATGLHSAYDEGVDPGGAPTPASDFTFAGRIDVGADQMLLSYKRNYLAIVPGATSDYSEIVAGQRGYVRGIESVFGGPAGTVGAPMSSARWAATRRHQVLSNPHLLLKGRAANDVRDEGLENRDGRSYRRIVVSDPWGIRDFTLRLDDAGRLAQLSTLESDHLRGDINVDVTYEQWEPSGGLLFPRRVSIAVDHQTVRVEDRSSIQVNAPLEQELFAMPDGPPQEFDDDHADFGHRRAQSYQRFAGLGLNSFVDPLHETVVGVEVATGVYHLVGTGHHSMLVDQGASSVLVEAPLDEERSKALLAWIDTNLPGGLAAHPISNVVMTHHHADHSAGLRTFVARGAAVVVAKESEAFMRDMFTSAHTISPDDLSARKDIVPVLRPVESEGSLAIGNVSVHHVRSSHAADMLIVHVTAAGSPGILFNSDLYNPTEGDLIPARRERAVGFNEAIIRLGLNTPDRIFVGGHGNMAGTRHFNVTYAQFQAQLARVQGQAP
ncbi:MBL fold metallo-hydrolase [Pendulispora rubella]|uniref:MBL fold metallo-hydrolase n=1 Tax=Pendulispora rubella TaxID=2741070 RepID=A0ABZ2LC11_9BACT